MLGLDLWEKPRVEAVPLAWCRWWMSSRFGIESRSARGSIGEIDIKDDLERDGPCWLWLCCSAFFAARFEVDRLRPRPFLVAPFA